MSNFAGIILAGGKSSRMGQNKSFLTYRGKTMLDIMAEKLKEAGASAIIVNAEPGEGPARAILDMTEKLKSYDGALFVPVDVPLMKAEHLKTLAAQKSGGFYGEHFLPVYIPVKKLLSLDRETFKGKNLSVGKLLETLDVRSLPMPQGDGDSFLNVNTPEAYEKLETL